MASSAPDHPSHARAHLKQALLRGNQAWASGKGKAGSRTPLVRRGEVVGMAVRTRTDVSPVYASVGHNVDIASAVEWVLASCRGRRLPETARAIPSGRCRRAGPGPEGTHRRGSRVGETREEKTCSKVGFCNNINAKGANYAGPQTEASGDAPQNRGRPAHVFDVPSKEIEIRTLEQESALPSFWDDPPGCSEEDAATGAAEGEGRTLGGSWGRVRPRSWNSPT